MLSHISEFSYGFAITHELLNSCGKKSKIAPVFPSLYKEGKTGGGYDVKLDVGIPVFIQFKISHYLYGKNSYGIKNNLFNDFYYKFEIIKRNKSNQHKMLVDLDKDLINQVYYAAPLFYTNEDFNHHYTKNEVIDNSIFVKPSRIGYIQDDDQHNILFNNNSICYFCSDPKKIELSNVFDEVNNIDPFTKKIIEVNYEDIYLKLLKKVHKIIINNQLISIENLEKTEELLASISTLEKISFFAKTFFNCQLYIAKSYE